MHRTHDFQRIYWSGAAFWLTVDRDLRRDSGGKMGLDTVLSRFRDCCLPSYRQWRPEDFVAKLDELSGMTTVSSRYREFSASQKFPDWKKIFADLGVVESGEHLHFDAAAPGAKIREAILTSRAPR